MSYRTVSAARGVEWLKEAVELVLRNPGVFLVQALILAIIGLIPFLGQLALLVLGPALTAGMIYSMREQELGRNAEIGQLFAGFQLPNKTGPLLALCLPALAGAFVILVLGFLFVGGSFLGAIFAGGNDAGAAVGVGVLMSLMVFSIIALVTAIAIYALIVFAIPRVLFDDVDAFEAMKESLSASLANFAPLVIFSVIFFVAAVLLFVVLSIIPVLGSIVAMLVIHAVTAAAIYVAYKDVFAAAPVESVIIVPPSPPAPPEPPAPPVAPAPPEPPVT